MLLVFTLVLVRTYTSVALATLCLDGRPAVNSTRISKLIAAAPKECRKQLLRDACQRLDVVADAASMAQVMPSSISELPAVGQRLVQAEMRYAQPQVVHIAFFIMAFGAISNLKRLVGRLHGPGHSFLLHLDRKASVRRVKDLQEWATYSREQGARLHIMEERFDVRRGGASFLLVLLRAMEVLISMSDLSWDYFINLNDNDYLLTSVSALQSYLSLHWSESFIHIGSPSAARCPANTTNCRKIDHLVVVMECIATGEVFSLLPADSEMSRWFRPELPIYSGPDLVGLWRPIVAHLVEELHKYGALADRVLASLKTAQQPDERFFQTFVRNGAGALGRYSHTLATFHVWDANRLDAGMPLQSDGDPVQIYSPPLLRSKANFSHLRNASLASASTHFARKFDAKRTAALQQLLDQDAQMASSLPWRSLLTSHGWDETVLSKIFTSISGVAAAPGQSWLVSPRHNLSNVGLQHLRITLRGGQKYVLAEKLAVAPSFDDGNACIERGLDDEDTLAEQACRDISLLRFVLAARVGVGWMEESLEFMGPVSAIPINSANQLDVVLYLGGSVFHEVDVVIEWRTPSGSAWHRAAVRIEHGTPIVWGRCRRAPRETGRWEIQISWQSADARALFLDRVRPECHGPDDSCHFQHGNALSKAFLYQVRSSREFYVYSDFDNLLRYCNSSCLSDSFSVVAETME